MHPRDRTLAVKAGEGAAEKVHLGGGVGEVDLLGDGDGIGSGEHHLACEGEGMGTGSGEAERAGIRKHSGVEAGGDGRGDGDGGGLGDPVHEFGGRGGGGDDIVDVGVLGQGFMMVDVDREEALDALQLGALETVALEDEDAVIMGGLGGGGAQCGRTGAELGGSGQAAIEERDAVAEEGVGAGVPWRAGSAPRQERCRPRRRPAGRGR